MWKRTPKKFVEFCDFVLWDFDHRNFAFVFAALAGRKKLQWIGQNGAFSTMEQNQ